MNKASPVATRKALLISQSYADAGIAFVPMPAISKADLKDLGIIAIARLNAISEIVESEGKDEQ